MKKQMKERKKEPNNQDRPIQSPKRYVLAFVIGTLIFILGFTLTTSISYLQFQKISKFQDETSYQIFNEKLSYTLFNKDICSSNSFQEISKSLSFQGAIIDDLEKKLGKENKGVLFRKKIYTLVELEHLEFINQLNENCNLSISTILFFYSNEQKDLGKSEETGRLLDTVNRRNDNLVTYSFDINLESNLIDELKKSYRIRESPTIIINQNKKIISPKNIDEIERYLIKVDDKEEDDGVIRL